MSKQMVSELIAEIVKQFMTVQYQNPLLAMEALFKFTSSTQINQALNNYWTNQNADEGKQIEFKHILESEPEVNQSEDEEVTAAQDKNGWSHEEDLILIESYFTYKSLPKRECFYRISALLEDSSKDPKACHQRYKDLDLKHLSSEEATAKSLQMHQTKATGKKQKKVQSAY